MNSFLITNFSNGFYSLLDLSSERRDTYAQGLLFSLSELIQLKQKYKSNVNGKRLTQLSRKAPIFFCLALSTVRQLHPGFVDFAPKQSEFPPSILYWWQEVVSPDVGAQRPLHHNGSTPRSRSSLDECPGSKVSSKLSPDSAGPGHTIRRRLPVYEKERSNPAGLDDCPWPQHADVPYVHLRHIYGLSITYQLKSGTFWKRLLSMTRIMNSLLSYIYWLK